MTETEFNQDQMERFLKTDRLADFMVKNMKGGTRAEQLEVVFNTLILNDSQMTKSYMKV